MIVAPVIYYSLPETFLGMWWMRAAYAVAWPLIADLAIVLAGAVSGKGLIQLSEPTATESDGVRRTYPHKCEHCDAQIKSPNAVGGHMKRYHPGLCKPKVLAEMLFAGAGEK